LKLNPFCLLSQER
ncbi:hypothetical protein HID58_052417, partial [Brassica napus]